MILGLACPSVALFVRLQDLRAMMQDSANIVAWVRGGMTPGFLALGEVFDPMTTRERLLCYLLFVPREVVLSVLQVWKSQEKANPLFSQLKPEDQTCYTIALDTLIDEVKTRQNTSN